MLFRSLKEKQAKMVEQMKEALRARDSAEVGLKTTEKQFEEIPKELHYSEINLAIEKQMVTELREELGVKPLMSLESLLIPT